MPNPLEQYINQVNRDMFLDGAREMARMLYVYYMSLLKSGFSREESLMLAAAYQTFLLANAGNTEVEDE